MNMSLKPIQGTSHPVGSESETLSAIRSALTEVDPEVEAKTKGTGYTKRKLEVVPRVSKATLFAPLEKDDSAAPKRAARKPIKLPKTPRGLLKRKYIVLGALIAAIVWKPVWALIAVLSLMLVFGLLLVGVGAETLWRGVMLAMHQTARKDQAKAVRMRQRLDAFAVKWDRFLDRFPDGSVDSLYMPDFQVISQEEALHEARLREEIRRAQSEI